MAGPRSSCMIERMIRQPMIFIVEDDPVIRSLVQGAFETEGFQARSAPDARAFWALLDQQEPDLVILDIMMPGEDGLSVCRKLQERSRVPVIITSARGEPLDRILGLEIGADDYLAKPFNDRELIARARAVLRRKDRDLKARTRQVFKFEEWTLETSTRRLSNASACDVELTSGEYDLLVLFLGRPQEVLSRDEITDALRGRRFDVYDRSIDVQVSRLRRKLNEQDRAVPLIRTIRNGGYMFAAEVRVSA